MKTLIVYSSLTGNTRRIAEAIAAALPDVSICTVEEAPAAEDYDFVALGYWVDKGLPDSKSQKYMERIQNRVVALFGTLGAWPHSEHAEQCRLQAESMMRQPQRGNTVLGTFLCQGRVDPKVVAMMQKMADSVHPMTEERRLRLEEAAKHPDEQDCRNAVKTFAAFAAVAQEIITEQRSSVQTSGSNTGDDA